MIYSNLPLLTKVLALSAILIAVIASIWMVVLGFQRKAVWGVALLLGTVVSYLPYLAPQYAPQNWFVMSGLNLLAFLIWLAFLIIDWREAKQPFFWTLASIVLLLMAIFSVPGYKVAQPGMTATDKLRSMMSSAMPAPNSSLSDSREEDYTTQSRFRSKLPPPSVPPGEKEPTRPGYFYLKERVSVVTKDGIKAANPGEQVILLKRLPKERMLIQVGNVDFEVEGSKLTDDLGQARELEKQDFVSRGGRL